VNARRTKKRPIARVAMSLFPQPGFRAATRNQTSKRLRVAALREKVERSRAGSPLTTDKRPSDLATAPVSIKAELLPAR
jgi:hypothetical protein